MSFRLKAYNRTAGTMSQDVLLMGETWPLLLRLANQYGFRGEAPLGEYEPDVAYNMTARDANDMSVALSRVVLPKKPCCLLAPISGRAWAKTIAAVDSVRALMAGGAVLICNDSRVAKDCH